MELVEIYVLCENRTQSLALKFLDGFAENRTNTAEDFPFPEYVDEPDIIYTKDTEVMAALEKQPSESYSLYWDTTSESAIKNAMLFYTEDGGLVAGVAVKDSDHEKWINKLAKVVNGAYGYVSFENVPPDTKGEFIELCNSSDQIKMVGGKVMI